MNTFTKLTQFTKDFWQDEEGLTIVEYAVAGALIAAALIVAFQALSTEIEAVLDYIAGILAASHS